ncbi:hypothetical protein GOP47_0022906 [Adiantum capillus-veneris]|uniref:Uncharacterized protein n=1 Tax=Adiantum capillus-veneris TaxID=13818 RepID=A0A9D4U7D7_ADICA|nr:hypothetical protein GOP47_0022906 [Adiantum capillus-veneris]
MFANWGRASVRSFIQFTLRFLEILFLPSEGFITFATLTKRAFPPSSSRRLAALAYLRLCVTAWSITWRPLPPRHCLAVC